MATFADAGGRLPSVGATPAEQEARLMELGKGEEKRVHAVDPFGGRKARTRQTIGGEREAAGGDQELLQNPKLKEKLQKEKEYKAGQENIMFVDTCEKVNDKIKHQERVLVVTTEAVYNVEPGSFKVKRRIDLRSIDEISVSCLDDDFLAMHVPSEYSDYLFVAPRKSEMAMCIKDQIKNLTGRDLKMNVSNGFSYKMSKQKYSIVFVQTETGTNVKIYK
jgi:hypothetical protein